MQSKSLATRVAEYACSSENAFKELIHCYLSEDHKLAQRAAYSLSIAARKKIDLMQPYVGILVDQLKRNDVHDAVIRNSARILEEIEIPEQFHGEVMDACFGFIQNRQTAIAIRAFSLTILYRLSLIYPEIKNELCYIIVENIDYETAAFRSRGTKILAALNKKTK
ncbi:hypothetical protein [Dyadobacter sp. CY323]|uniref:hypothetical protein n=1 Tax=Dyadobacter sp. CY323 TaxID=2907302 RepID=UPI001F2F167F|nr:hypothetical protein [Dyadobacter sp. CY323]